MQLRKPKHYISLASFYSTVSLKGVISGLFIRLGLAARLLLPDLKVAVANCSLLSVLANMPLPPIGNCKAPGVVARDNVLAA
jgi:hypothetical protein